jgi:hypothetical protein
MFRVRWRSEEDQHLRCKTLVLVFVRHSNLLQANPNGVVTVGFANYDQADACCRYMNERIWHGRVIRCQTWDGVTKYNVTASADEEKQRIDQWHQYLNEDGDDDDGET